MALGLIAGQLLKHLMEPVDPRLHLVAIQPLLEQIVGRLDRDFVGEIQQAECAPYQQVEVDCLEQLLVAPTEAFLEDEHRHQQANRCVRATVLFIEKRAKALFGNALGNLIQENVVPCIRVIVLCLVTLAQKLFDVAEQIDLAAVRTGSEHRRWCSVGNSVAPRYFTTHLAGTPSPEGLFGGDSSVRSAMSCSKRLNAN